MDHCQDLLAELSGKLRAYPPYQPMSQYNIFSVLGVSGKEVIMCRFLADLLDPAGAHGLGTLFLRTFLQMFLPDCPMSEALLVHTDVGTEVPIDDGRRIDIVIQNPQYFIPIEVKIWAGEERGQCYDYYQHAKNAPLIYLTRSGSPPSGYSRAQKGEVLLLDHIRCISWARDINEWLTGLLQELDGPVKPMIEQYIDTIYKITDGQRQEVMDKITQTVLESPDHFSAALQIERNIQSIKTAKLAVMRSMFDCFKEEMEPVAAKYDLELETDTKYFFYEHPAHNAFYDTRSSTNPGLNYVIKHAVFRKSSLQMWFRIEVYDNLYAGITLFDTAAEPQYVYPKGNELDEISPELLEEAVRYLDRDIFTPLGWWLTWCYPNGVHQDGDYPDVPNFRTMNQCAIDLVDPVKRKRYVRNAVKVFERELLVHFL